MIHPKMPPNVLPYGADVTLDEAKRIMAAAEQEAEKQGWPMVISICDTGGKLVMLTRATHAQKGSVAVAQAKAETAALFRRPTKVFQDLVEKGGAQLRILAMPGVTPVDGGLPIVKDGYVLGGIGVSGMASDQDAIVANAGLAAL